MRKSFDIENIDLDGLIDTVMTDKQAAAGEVAGFKGIKFNDLHLAYKQFCKHEKIASEVGRHRPGDRVLQPRGGRPARPQPAQGPEAARA